MSHRTEKARLISACRRAGLTTTAAMSAPVLRQMLKDAGKQYLDKPEWYNALAERLQPIVLEMASKGITLTWQAELTREMNRRQAFQEALDTEEDP